MSTSTQPASKNKRRYALTTTEWIFLAFCLGMMLFWTCAQQYNYAPDEYSRALLPKYLYFNHALPSGWDEAVRFAPQGISFAFRFTFLPAIVSAFGMDLAGLVSTNPVALLFGARCGSVLFGIISVYFIIKIAKRLFSGAGRWVFVFLSSLIPQFIFLSSYINNDIACVCGAFIIAYSWIKAREEGWTIPTCLFLSTGLSVVLLSYYNAYAWLLMSALFFIGLCLFQTTGWREGLRKAGLVVFVVVVLSSGFVIRNVIIYDGDITGQNSSSESAELYQDDELIVPDSASEFGYSISDVLLGSAPDTLSIPFWVKMTCKSFIGYFGYMSVPLATGQYLYYFVLFGVGVVCFIAAFIKRIEQHRKIPHDSALFYCCLGLIFFITLAIMVYFSFTSSYQPQGRYLYAALFPIVCIVAKGYEFMLNSIKSAPLRKAVSFTLCASLAFFVLVITATVFVPSAAGIAGEPFGAGSILGL